MKTFKQFIEAQEYLEERSTTGSDKHSDLYTDENPKGTIHGLDLKMKDCKGKCKENK